MSPTIATQAGGLKATSRHSAHMEDGTTQHQLVSVSIIIVEPVLMRPAVLAFVEMLLSYAFFSFEYLKYMYKNAILYLLILLLPTLLTFSSPPSSFLLPSPPLKNITIQVLAIPMVAEISVPMVAMATVPMATLMETSTPMVAILGLSGPLETPLAENNQRLPDPTLLLLFLKCS